MFYTDPTNVLIHKLRAQLGRRIHNIAAVEYQERTVDYTGDWQTKNRLELDWEKVRSEAHVDFEAEIFPPIWAFVVENVRASKSKSVRLKLWLWQDCEGAKGGVEMVEMDIFPLPLAGIRLRGEDKHSPQDPLAKAVRAGKGRDFVDALLGEVTGTLDEVEEEVKAKAATEIVRIRKKGKQVISDAVGGFMDELFSGLRSVRGRKSKDDDGDS